MGNFIKKNWFLCLLVLALCGISIFYIVDTNKGKLKGKSVNGEDVVYSINGKDITTSEFYNQLFKDGGIGAASELFRQAVAEQGVETTEEIEAFAKEQADAIRQTYITQYPSNYKEVIGNSLQTLGYSGYDDLEKYLANFKKQETLAVEYAKAHFDELQIRNVSYILIQYENGTPSETPTDDEQARMDAVDKAFADGDDFATVATNFSEDTSSAPNGGILGVIDNKVTNLDEAFLNAALALKEDEVSDWVKSDNFGYFKIKNNASTYDKLVSFFEEHKTADTAYDNPLVELANSYDTTLSNVALFDKAEQLGMDFKDQPELYEAIRAFFGMDAE